jgi:hypothetical protein
MDYFRQTAKSKQLVINLSFGGALAALCTKTVVAYTTWRKPTRSGPRNFSQLCRAQEIGHIQHVSEHCIR